MRQHCECVRDQLYSFVLLLCDQKITDRCNLREEGFVLPRGLKKYKSIMTVKRCQSWEWQELAARSSSHASRPGIRAMPVASLQPSNLVLTALYLPPGSNVLKIPQYYITVPQGPAVWIHEPIVDILHPNHNVSEQKVQKNRLFCSHYKAKIHFMIYMTLKSRT